MNGRIFFVKNVLKTEFFMRYVAVSPPYIKWNVGRSLTFPQAILLKPPPLTNFNDYEKLDHQ